MNKYILVLRGINVGGRRKILMADLKVLLSQLNYQNIQTYIQSGNVIFDSGDIINLSKEEEKISDLITEKYGLEVPIIIIKSSTLLKIFQQTPFVLNSDIVQLHCTFFKVKPSSALVENFNKLSFKPDEFLIKDSVIFIKCAGKYSNTKLTNSTIERKLKVSATTRNWKTITKLVEMCKA